MTAKTIAHAEQFAVVDKEHVAHPIAHSEPFAVVVSDDERGAVIVAAGAQGPAGRDGKDGKDGIDGSSVSNKPKNRLTKEEDGLYVSNDLLPDPLAYYILAKN